MFRLSLLYFLCILVFTQLAKGSKVPRVHRKPDETGLVTATHNKPKRIVGDREIQQSQQKAWDQVALAIGGHSVWNGEGFGFKHPLPAVRNSPRSPVPSLFSQSRKSSPSNSPKTKGQNSPSSKSPKNVRSELASPSSPKPAPGTKLVPIPRIGYLALRRTGSADASLPRSSS